MKAGGAKPRDRQAKFGSAFAWLPFYQDFEVEMFHRRAPVSLLVLCALLSACSQDQILGSDAVLLSSNIANTSATRQSPRMNLLLDEQIKLRQSTSNGRARSVSWISSNPSVALVSPSGVVTARGIGSAVIVFRSGLSIDSTVVTVPQVAQVIIATPKVRLDLAEQTVLSASAITVNGDTLIPRVVSWQLRSGTAVSISNAGMATGVAQGVASIAATAGGVQGTLELTVGSVTPLVSTFTISPRSVSVQAGANVQFTTTTVWSDGGSYPSNVTYRTVGGGSINVNGLFSAAQVTGTFAVIASCSCGRVDTAAVTVAASAPPPAAVELPRVFLDDMVSQARAAPVVRTINVATGSQLQAALDTSRYGDHLVLQANSTYTGSFVLRRKTGTGWITIRSSSSLAALPAAGTRMRPSMASLLPKITAAYPAEPAIRTESGAVGYRIFALEVLPPAGATSGYSLVSLGSAGSDQSSLSSVPSDILLDRVYLHGSSSFSFQRCLALNSARTAIVDSWLSECHGKGFDSQAIAGWNGPGPFKIVNNHLEGAGENLMIGGADPKISGLVPSDIEIRRNYFYKPITWQGVWSVKNSFELKMGLRVLVEGNIFENNWVDAQNGFAIVLKSTNQENTAPWSQTADVTFRSNIVRNSAMGMSLAGNPEVNPVVPMSRLLVANNVFERIGSGSVSSGRLWQASEVDNLSFVSNTGFGVTAGLILYGRKMSNLVVRDNVFGTTQQNWGTWDYAITSADGGGFGTQALNTHTSSYILANNLIPGVRAAIFPNSLIPLDFSSLQMVGWPTDLRLPSDSPYRTASSTGAAPGADFTSLGQWTSGVIVTP